MQTRVGIVSEPTSRATAGPVQYSCDLCGDGEMKHTDYEGDSYNSNSCTTNELVIIVKNKGEEEASVADDQDAAADGDSDDDGDIVLQLRQPSHSDHNNIAGAHSRLLNQVYSAEADQDAAAHDDQGQPDDHLCPKGDEQLRSKYQYASAQSHSCSLISTNSAAAAPDKDNCKLICQVDGLMQEQQGFNGSSKFHGKQPAGKDSDRQRRHCSLVQAFSDEDYTDLQNFVNQPAATEHVAAMSLCTTIAKESYPRVKASSCRLNTSSSMYMRSKADSNNSTNIFDDVATRCGSSSFHLRDEFLHSIKYSNGHENTCKQKAKEGKYSKKGSPYNYTPMKEQSSYILRGVGLAFKWSWPPHFQWRSLFGGHLPKASARVWVQEDSHEGFSVMDSKLSSSHSKSAPAHSHDSFRSFSRGKPTEISLNATGKSVVGSFLSGKSATFSFIDGRSARYSPSTAISTRYSPSAFNHLSSSFQSNLGSLDNSIPGYSSYSDDSLYNAINSINSASNPMRSSSSSNSSTLNPSTKAEYTELPQESDMKKIRSCVLGKKLNVLSSMGRIKLNVNHEQQCKSVRSKKVRSLDRNCNVSSFHEELARDSIQGAIAHCKESMAISRNAADSGPP